MALPRQTILVVEYDKYQLLLYKQEISLERYIEYIPIKADPEQSGNAK